MKNKNSGRGLVGKFPYHYQKMNETKSVILHFDLNDHDFDDITDFLHSVLPYVSVIEEIKKTVTGSSDVPPLKAGVVINAAKNKKIYVDEISEIIQKSGDYNNVISFDFSHTPCLQRNPQLISVLFEDLSNQHQKSLIYANFGGFVVEYGGDPRIIEYNSVTHLYIDNVLSQIEQNVKMRKCYSKALSLIKNDLSNPHSEEDAFKMALNFKKFDTILQSTESSSHDGRHCYQLPYYANRDEMKKMAKSLQANYHLLFALSNTKPGSIQNPGNLPSKDVMQKIFSYLSPGDVSHQSSNHWQSRIEKTTLPERGDGTCCSIF